MPATTPTKAQKPPLASVLMPALGAGRAGASAPWRAPASPRSCDPRAAEEALRPHEQCERQEHERDDRLVDRVHTAGEAAPGGHLLRDAEGEAARQRTVGAADPAEDDRGEHGQQQLEPEVRLERILDEAGQN